MLKHKSSARAALVLNETGAATATPPAQKVSAFRKVVFNLGKVKIRHEMLEGVEHLVVPMVMLTEGVHEGSLGPIYYPSEELSRVPQVWNYKPITLGHPPIGASGCDLVILNSRKLGVCLNTKFDGRLASEAWLNKKRCKELAPDLPNRLEKGESVEVSTGLWTENEDKPGVWNGEAYTSIARNHKPDHLAILMESTGACSIADGAGLLVNEVSHDAKRDLVQSALREDDPNSYGYVVDVFDKFFVYSSNKGMFKREYTANDTMATLSGEPVSVVRVVQYRAPDGTVVANVERKLTMNKAQMIAFLITNGGGLFTESDKAFLEGKDEKVIKSLHDQIQTKLTANAAPAPLAPITPLPTAAPLPTPVANGTNAPAKPQTLDESLATLHPDVRRQIVNAINNENRAKEKLITDILTNKMAASFFTKETLAAKNVDELQVIANMAGIPAQGSGNGIIPLFGGMADPAGLPPVTTHNEKPLEELAPQFASPFKK